MKFPFLDQYIIFDKYTYIAGCLGHGVLYFDLTHNEFHFTVSMYNCWSFNSMLSGIQGNDIWHRR